MPDVAALLRAKQQREDDELPAWALPDVAALCSALEQPPPTSLPGESGTQNSATRPQDPQIFGDILETGNG